MNILLITKSRIAFFTLKKFFEEKGNVVLDIGIATQYTEEEVITYVPKKINELILTDKIDLILIDYFLKNEECQWSEDSDFPSVLIITEILKKYPSLKVAFMTDSCKLSNISFHQDYKNIDQKWLLIHKPSISKELTITDGEDKFMNCPYLFDENIKCRVGFNECTRLNCFYNLVLLAATN